MKFSIPHVHLVLAWTWTVFGFASGLLLGLNFHKEEWLGGYASHKRRLYRLGHISFFGLAMINLFFYFTAQKFSAAHLPVIVASWAFIVGAVSMPICCGIIAQDTKWRALFAIPVSSLLTGGLLTLWEVIQL